MENKDLFARFGMSEPPAFSNDLKIVIAEGRNDLRLIIAHQLEKMGFTDIRKFRDGRAALEGLRKKTADIVLAGDDLPAISGLELLKELREDPSLSRGAFLLVSQPLNRGEVMLAIESGVNDFLIRPVIPADILPKIRAAYNGFINPRNPERLYEQAKLKIRNNEHDQAREIYNALADSAPKAARPQVGLARVAFAEGKNDEAIRLAGEGIARNTNYVHAYAFRAEILLKQGKVNEAVNDLKKAVTLSPLNLARVESCCEILISRDMTDACTSILETSMNAGLNHPYVVERLGHCYFLRKEYARAIGYIKDALRMEPENVSFLNALAICFRDAKNFDEAISTYNQILKKEPDNHLVLFNKSLVLIYRGNKQEAAKILQRITKIAPDFKKAQEKLQELSESTGTV